MAVSRAPAAVVMAGANRPMRQGTLASSIRHAARAALAAAACCAMTSAASAETPPMPNTAGEGERTATESARDKPIVATTGQSDKAVTTGDKAFDYDTRRFEPAGFPLLGGDSDIGFEFGAVGTFTEFGEGVRPYLWNLDVLLAASLKNGPHGTELTQQNYLVNLDVPGLNDGRLRLNPSASYERTVNQGYFGVGNATSTVRPAGGDPGRYFQFDEREARVRELTRVAWHAPFDLMFATTYRYVTPGAYQNSRLADDAAAGTIRGLRPLSILLAGAGIVYDTRDNEFFARRGAFHQIGFRAAQGLPADAGVRYGAFGAILATYLPADPFVLALRGVVDAQFGNVPFYDLYTGGPFQTYEMLGGSAGIRGVPDGRYLGELKVLGNAELRALFFEFHLFGQGFRTGGNVLFDAGRLWKDYSFKAPEDGKGLGLKWGAGGGLYLIWGQAAVFRVEVAYSPDAVAENASLPLGIYVEDGVMF